MKISVIIPMYNAENTIVTALNSIKNQTYKCDYEIIVINDGSNDNSKAIVEKYILENPQLTIILVNQTNGGVSRARNEGLKRVTGDYIALLDSDDEWLPQKIEEQVLVLQKNNNIDFLGTNRNGEHFKSFLGYKFSNLTKISARMLLIKNFFPTPTILMKRKIIDEVGFFDENKKLAEEGDYWIRICSRNNCFLLNKSLVITGGGKPSFGHSGLSSNLWEMEKGDLKIIKEAHNQKIINIFECYFLYVFSLCKYFRRVIIVKLRKND